MIVDYPHATIYRIKNGLPGKKETIAVAESLTTGQLQAALSLAENARLPQNV